MTAPIASSRRAFTLIELLVVIAIIGILMTLLFPAVSGAIYTAQKTQAKNGAVQIANAIEAYNTEYGKLPIEGAGGDVTASQQTDGVMDALCPPNPSAPPALNPRGITFLEIPKAKSGANGRVNNAGPYLDTWRTAYYISMDGDYDNKVQGPSGNSAQTDIRKTVIVWSKGDTVNHQKETQNPEKWIKSWE